MLIIFAGSILHILSNGHYFRRVDNNYSWQCALVSGDGRYSLAQGIRNNIGRPILLILNDTQFLRGVNTAFMKHYTELSGVNTAYIIQCALFSGVDTAYTKQY